MKALKIFPKGAAEEHWNFRKGEYNMSCTMVLIPAALGGAQIVGSLITTLVTGAVVSTAIKAAGMEKNRNALNNYEAENLEQALFAKTMNEQYEQYQAFCSQYKTIFKDESLLIKTLSEHGVQNITSQDNKVYGNLDALKFKFEKNEEGLYIMNITHNKDEDLSVVEELNEEYQLNVQEQSYMNIKKNLEKQNLQIDTEEVLEDNSIMLTVNLE